MKPEPPPAPPRPSHRLIHGGIVKPLLLTLLRNHGAKGVLVNWQGTDDEAIDAIVDDPRDVFVFDSACDNRNPDGSCAGHEKR